MQMGQIGDKCVRQSGKFKGREGRTDRQRQSQIEMQAVWEKRKD